MPDVRLRSAKPADALTVERVARESWHAAYDDFLSEGTVNEVVDEWYDLDGLRDAAGDDEQVLIVATGNNDVRGFAHAAPGPERGAWHLLRIYVVPDHWHEGIGTALLERIEDDLEVRGVPAYELAVLAANDIGVSFYESHGFERFETEKAELAGVEVTQHRYRKEF